MNPPEVPPMTSRPPERSQMATADFMATGKSGPFLQLREESSRISTEAVKVEVSVSPVRPPTMMADVSLFTLELSSNELRE